PLPRNSDISLLTSAWFVTFLFLVASTISLIAANKTTVLLEMRSTGGDAGEVFYARGGGGYTPEHSQPFAIRPDGQWHRYSIELPGDRNLSGIRIDPGASGGGAHLRSITLERAGRTTQINGAVLAHSVQTQNDLEYASEND